jgi:hypothetical protein
MAVPLEMVDRTDIMQMLKCSYSKACRVFKNIKSTIPDEDLKEEHSFHLPEETVKKYFNPPPKIQQQS